uniref:Immunoglobulin domain-containing protein n=1 Tax=Loxodonta africana TaxID=9785 RepID=G3SQV4_LOXAF
MAWKAPLLQLLLLPLFSGVALTCASSAGFPKVEKLQRRVGETLSVRCQYPTGMSAYERKSLCKEVSAYQCISLVSSSYPQTLAQASRFSIWDSPRDGFFTVTMISLTEEDSGHYWCRTYHASRKSVSRSTKFYLVVSTASTRTPYDQVSAQTPSSLAPTGGASKALRASSGTTAPSQQQNSTLTSSPEAPSVLVPVLCGLLVAKSLMLAALFVL